MEKLHTIVQFLDTLLDTRRIEDSSYNGLQFEGAGNVRKVVCAVDAGATTFEEARRRGAQMVVVHHGQFWLGVNPSIRRGAKKRLALLFEHGISLYAAHLPLDMHPAVGNNAMLVKKLGARITGPFGRYGRLTIGFRGEFPAPVPLDTLVRRISFLLDTQCTVLPYGKKRVRTMGVVSGGASRSNYMEAVEEGLDVFLTGEQTDIVHDAADQGVACIFAGHHASETLGVKQLAAVLRKRLDIEAEFVDIPTGL
jgi:dinuclear metal center YbgI/SA1388 family protein